MFDQSHTPLQAMQRVRRMLAQAGDTQAQSKARLLLCALYRTDMHGLLLTTEPLGVHRAMQLESWLQRCMAGEPVQYVLQRADFMGHTFTVTPDVLIPRRDSEILAQWAIRQAPPRAKILDLCTGSGCLAIAVKLERKDVQVMATDISAAACAIAQKNGTDLGASVVWKQGDLCTPVQGESFDVIISNPPYIDEEEMRSLEPQVRRFEPHLALFGGKDGLDVYRRLIPDCRRCLSPGGWLGVEIGYAQGRAVRELMQTYGYGNVKVLTDMEHRDRVVIGCRGEGERNDRPLEKNQSAL